MRTIALVPLDSRPCCAWFPQQIAALGGVRLLTPPIGLLGKFMTPGDCEGIRDWAGEAARQADGFVISADQLAYGGLIASRTGERTADQALAMLDLFHELKENYPSKPVFAASVLMRITITGKNALFVKWKELVQRYSELTDEVGRLGRTELAAELERVTKAIPQEVLADFLRSRERNMHVHRKLIDLVADGVIDYLTITQEDASPVGIHLGEQRQLQRHMYDKRAQARTILYPGADEATQTLLARMMQTLEQRRLKVFPRFTSESGKLAVPKYEDRPVEETVKAHLWAAGAIVADSPEEADLILAINAPLAHMTGDGKEASDVKALFDSRHLLTDLVERTRCDLAAGRRVAIADVALPNASDVELVRYLLDERLFARLSGYAGWNTAGNTLGTCIAHAIARTLRRTGADAQAGAPPNTPAGGSAAPGDADAADAAHYGFLFSRLMDEWGYQAQVRGEVNEWIAAETSVSPWELEGEYDRVNALAAGKLAELFEAVKPALQDGAAEAAARASASAELAVARLPWNRTFEADVRVDVKLASSSASSPPL